MPSAPGGRGGRRKGRLSRTAAARPSSSRGREAPTRRRVWPGGGGGGGGGGAAAAVVAVVVGAGNSRRGLTSERKRDPPCPGPHEKIISLRPGAAGRTWTRVCTCSRTHRTLSNAPQWLLAGPARRPGRIHVGPEEKTHASRALGRGPRPRYPGAGPERASPARSRRQFGVGEPTG